MPNYRVVMGQGITVADLGNNMLLTGVATMTHRDWILSCSAIMFFNKTTRAAGLFHYPAGNILSDGDSRNVLHAMYDAVAPTEGHIAYGVHSPTNMSLLLGTAKPSTEPTDYYASVLRTFVTALLKNLSLGYKPATSKTASISQKEDAAIIGSENPGTSTDLCDFSAAPYDDFTIYGKAK
jgi:hypothetical protein